MIRIFLSAVLTAMTLTLSAQDLLGKWKTIDDEIEGRVKSIVEITSGMASTSVPWWSCSACLTRTGSALR